MRNILLTILMINSVLCLGQEKNLILTEKANEIWFESLKEINALSDKIEFISERMRNDVDVYIEWSFPDGIKVKNIQKLDSLKKIRIQGFCKPLYIVKYESEQTAFRYENPIDGHKVDSVIALINTDNIKRIEIWTDNRKVIYGTSADCGIIFLDTKKRTVYEALLKLKVTNHYLDEIASYPR